MRGTPQRPSGAAASALLASAPPCPPSHTHGDMAHAQARCPSARGSGDGEMGKPRKVALITGITGQVSAEAGAGGLPAAAGARVRFSPRLVQPPFPGTAFWASRKASAAREVGDKM